MSSISASGRPQMPNNARQKFDVSTSTSSIPLLSIIQLQITKYLTIVGKKYALDGSNRHRELERSSAERVRRDKIPRKEYKCKH